MVVPPVLLLLLLLGGVSQAALRPRQHHRGEGGGPAWPPGWGRSGGCRWHLPAGPIMGNGDLGVTLQTNNSTGCIELWLGLSSMWGMPAAGEAPAGLDGLGRVYNPTAPYPATRARRHHGLRAGPGVPRGQRRLRLAVLCGRVVEATANCHAGQTFASRLVVHPASKTLVTSLSFTGRGKDRPCR